MCFPKYVWALSRFVCTHIDRLNHEVPVLHYNGEITTNYILFHMSTANTDEWF